MNIAIIGTGNIGTDLLFKVRKSKYLNCTYFVGRNLSSRGIEIAKNMGIKTSSNGVSELLENSTQYDLVLDATSAVSHMVNIDILKGLNKKIIDLTPAKVGRFCAPSINYKEVLNNNNINMITCGGQASIPVAYAFSEIHSNIDYIEVVSSISSKSAGPATRDNIDEYLCTTEKAIKEFSNCNQSKAILNINPSVPEVCMKTTIMAIIKNPDLKLIEERINFRVNQVKEYIPGYDITVPVHVDQDRVIVTVKVVGSGDFLPSYSGNLDIITASAVRMAELIAINNGSK